MSRVGDNIKEARVKAGVSQKVLAKKLGVAEKYINEIELGRRVVPENFIEKVSKALNIKLDEISMVVTDAALEQERKAEATTNTSTIEKKLPPKSLGETSDVWTDAFSSVLKKVNIYDYSLNKVLGSKDLPNYSNKVEGYPADKVLYIKVQDDDMAGFRIMSGDLAFAHLVKEISGNGIFLIEHKGQRVIRQVKNLGNSRILLISNKETTNTETVELSNIKIIAKIERIEILL